MSKSAGEEVLDRCLVCGSGEWSAVREGTDLCRPNYPKIFKLARCVSCGHVMQIPVPDVQELDAAYSVSGDYVCYRPAWREKGWPLWKILRTWTTSRRVDRLKKHATGRDLLEVGCGAGDFLVAAQKAGWKACAVEYNPEMVQALREKFGFDIRVGELAPNLWENSAFDAVAFWNVLEHVRNPITELTTAAQYLRPGGQLFLNIPSKQAAERGMWFGERWALLDLPRHIYFFDEEALSRVCEKAGLELKVYQTPFVQSAWCYYMSCWNWASRNGKSLGSWGTFFALSAVVTVCLPYFAWESASKRGLDAFAVATKPASS